MNPTLKLKTIAMTWRDILMESGKIRGFCQEKYGKPPTIFMGMNGQRLPVKETCPYIAIVGGVKKEGLEEESFLYHIGISWVIMQSNALVDGEIKPWSEKLTGETIECMGVYECDELGQLIYEVLQEALGDSWPISKIDYEVDWAPPYFPQWPGHMVAATSILPTMGEEIEY
ncbi:MAG: hypothetical protein K0Q85_27 [Caproiciproducens sp.]|jgi:hypothetical protein|nr:hypothetical protein [Caproiciproducens sp.]